MRRLTERREKKSTQKGDKDGKCVNYSTTEEIYGKYKGGLSLLSRTILIGM